MTLGQDANSDTLRNFFYLLDNNDMLSVLEVAILEVHTTYNFMIK